ncbi:MAG TPA: hypothetical protein VKA18_09040, partial [Alphaproteobacteria bacterium]|nr:hypothetical protein [Alphaproteobacteria bacterium]
MKSAVVLAMSSASPGCLAQHLEEPAGIEMVPGPGFRHGYQGVGGLCDASGGPLPAGVPALPPRDEPAQADDGG